jgi:hypothetical protein
LSTSRAWLASGFFVCAFAVRLILTHTESRFQILGFWLFAAILEAIVFPFFGERFSPSALAADGLAATCAVLIVKFYLEGFRW